MSAIVRDAMRRAGMKVEDVAEAQDVALSNGERIELGDIACAGATVDAQMASWKSAIKRVIGNDKAKVQEAFRVLKDGGVKAVLAWADENYGKSVVDELKRNGVALSNGERIELASAKKPRFKDGQRVKLKAFEDNPVEFGVVDGYDAASKTYIVTIDRKYRQDKYDDGLREVTEDQMVLA